MNTETQGGSDFYYENIQVKNCIKRKKKKLCLLHNSALASPIGLDTGGILTLSEILSSMWPNSLVPLNSAQLIPTFLSYKLLLKP